MATEFDARRSETLAWVARLPFVSASQLALLLGNPELTVNTGLHALEREGWLDWVDSPVPDADAGRLYVLTDEAWKWVGERFAGPDVSPLPLARNELLHRLAGIEATIAFNRFVAELAVTSRREQDLELCDALSLPVRRREAWWPPGVLGLAVLQQGERVAPLLVAIDRPAAPAAHRATTVAGWHAHRDGGRRSTPDAPIIVVAADDRTADEWKQAVAGGAERRGVLPLDLLVAPPGTGLRGPLLTGLRWHSEPRTCRPITSVFDSSTETLPRSLRLHEWARQALGEAPPRARRAQRERVAALSLFASPEQLRLLETIGRLPLLTESALGLVLAVTPPLLRRQVERAERDGLVEAVVRPNSPKRLVLGEFGLRLLAARAGVPFRRFASHMPFVAALPGAAGGRLQTLVRQFEHTVGANSFMLACLRNSSDPEFPTLVRWQNPIEAAVRFESGGVRRTLRPDGGGKVLQGEKSHEFLLEWDRGTERINVLLEKLTRYAACYRSATAASANVLLVVTPTPHREAVVWRAVSAVMWPEAERGAVRTTVASLVDQYGPYASIWRQFGSEARESWPGQ
ncbi:MAG: replication-relaxation family protein [Hyphomicrobiales bacterium]